MTLKIIKKTEKITPEWMIEYIPDPQIKEVMMSLLSDIQSLTIRCEQSEEDIVKLQQKLGMKHDFSNQKG